MKLSAGVILGAVAFSIHCGFIHAQSQQGGDGGIIPGNASTDKEKGHKCYLGTCGTCSQNCSTKATVTACYACCSTNGCDASPLTWCQGYCDGSNRPASDPRLQTHPAETLNKLQSIYRTIENGGLLVAQDVWDLDRVIASDTIANRKFALAILLDAYAKGQYALEKEIMADIVGEIHHACLFHADDRRLQSTAIALGLERGILGNRDRVADQFALLQMIAESDRDSDDRLIRLFLRN